MLTVAVFVSLALLCALVKVKRNGGNAGLGGAGAALGSEATENKRHGALKKGRGVACAMTSSLICINLSLNADWSRAGETEAARAFHPFQRSLSRSQSVCACVLARIAERSFILYSRRRASLSPPVDGQSAPNCLGQSYWVFSQHLLPVSLDSQCCSPGSAWKRTGVDAVNVTDWALLEEKR